MPTARPAARDGACAPHRPLRRAAQAVPAFTLLEMMVVVAIIGIVAALATPTLFDIAQRGKAAAAIDETVSALAVIRDDARGNQVCLRVTPSSTAVPLTLRVVEIACAGSTSTGTFATRTDVLDPLVTALRVRRVINGTPGTALPSFDFDRDGALSPTTTLQFDMTIAGQPRRLLMYPAAGTLEEQHL